LKNEACPTAEWWRFSRCENQRRVQRRNAFGNVNDLRAPVPPAAARAEFSQRENDRTLNRLSGKEFVSGR
jgi:hypothetical protein